MSKPEWASASADYDCDGMFDIFKTNFADDTCNLYHNNGDGTFTDVTFASGIGINNHYVAWGCGFVDYDNDGWPDIIQVNGHVYPGDRQATTSARHSRIRASSTRIWEMATSRMFPPRWVPASVNDFPAAAPPLATTTMTATSTHWC